MRGSTALKCLPEGGLDAYSQFHTLKNYNPPMTSDFKLTAK